MGSRLWEIRESYGDRMGYRDDRMMGEKAPMTEEEHEAYKCGYEDGYEDAMRESKSSMGERYGNRMGERYMGERGRMRDSMGRFR